MRKCKFNRINCMAHKKRHDFDLRANKLCDVRRIEAPVSSHILSVYALFFVSLFSDDRMRSGCNGNWLKSSIDVKYWMRDLYCVSWSAANKKQRWSSEYKCDTIKKKSHCKWSTRARPCYFSRILRFFSLPILFQGENITMRRIRYY